MVPYRQPAMCVAIQTKVIYETEALFYLKKECHENIYKLNE
jgi:hypothetical protein